MIDRNVFHLYTWRERDAFKESAHIIGRAGKFETHRAGQQDAKSQTGVDASGLRQNFFFRWETCFAFKAFQ